MRPVNNYEWLTTQNLEPARHLDGCKTLFKNVAGNGAVEELFHCCDCNRCVITLVVAVQRHKDIFIARPHGAHGHQPPTDGQVICRHLEVIAAHDSPRANDFGTDVFDIVTNLTLHEHTVGFDDANFFPGDMRMCRPGKLGVI